MDKESQLSMIDVPVTQRGAVEVIEPLKPAEPEPVPNVLMTNAQKLPWPPDRMGITHRLRREGCRAIGRMDGKTERLTLIKDTLRVLARHAEAKIDQQNLHRARSAMKQLKAQDASKAANLESMKRQENALKKQISSLGKRLERVKGNSS